MGVTAVRAAPVDLADVQGLVRFGYGKMTQASYLLTRVKDPSAARLWLRGAPMTSAETMARTPRSALQVAFTAAGLSALGVEPAIVAGFSPEFVGGMTEQNRVRRSGDVG